VPCTPAQWSSPTAAVNPEQNNKVFHYYYFCQVCQILHIFMSQWEHKQSAQWSSPAAAVNPEKEISFYQLRILTSLFLHISMPKWEHYNVF
jgi:hypothetical protein